MKCSGVWWSGEVSSVSGWWENHINIHSPLVAAAPGYGQLPLIGSFKDDKYLSPFIMIASIANCLMARLASDGSLSRGSNNKFMSVTFLCTDNDILDFICLSNMCTSFKTWFLARNISINRRFNIFWSLNRKLRNLSVHQFKPTIGFYWGGILNKYTYMPNYVFLDRL